MLPILRTRWKAFAHCAARFQSNVTLAALYFVVLLPLALIRRAFRSPLAAHPGWHERSPASHDLVSARRQF